MPIPTPRQGETREAFIQRCMDDDSLRQEFDDVGQHAAVCYDSYRTDNMGYSEITGQTIKANYSLRNETFEGIPHVVVPVVILTEGVHFGGNRIAVYYPREEMQRMVVAWNGIPLPIRHPVKSGNFTSANDPRVIEDQSVGRLFNVRYEEKNGTARLRGEAWIDPAKADRISPGLMARIQARNQIEVSTGLFTDDEQAAGVWNGEQYTVIARNFRPDHLAILPNETGACSIADGCGIRANKAEGKDMEKNTLEFFIKANAGESLLGVVAKVREAIDAMDSDSAVHYLREIYPADGDMNTGTVIVRVSTRGGEMRQRSEKMLKVGYAIADGRVTFSGDPEEVNEVITYEPITANTKPDCGCGKTKPLNLNTGKKGAKDMAKSTPERAEKVSAVITANVGYTEEHRDFLMGMECDQFAPILGMVEFKANTGKVPDTVDGILALLPDGIRAHAQDGIKANTDKRKGLIETLTANGCPFSADKLEKMDTAELEGLVAFKGNKQEAKPDFSLNGGAKVPKANASDDTPMGVPTYPKFD